MNLILRSPYIIIRKLRKVFFKYFDYYYTYYKFRVFSVSFYTFTTRGIPILDLSEGSTLEIGKNFKMNNGLWHNMIGRQQPCFFIGYNNAKIIIGDNVGISSTAIHSNLKVEIGNNVKIGGNTVIYDTDFHSINFNERGAEKEDIGKVNRKEVLIMDNVFIGAHCTILKGVVIGENSVVGAGSVVSKSIPPNEIWAGNPAKFLKSL